jgi:hypothetical protein
MAVEAVFLSSVVGGFEDVRDAEGIAIEGMGLHPIRSEQLSAEPMPSRRALLDRVGEAEYYLLLVGARYGAPEDGSIAPTEDEYREAARLGKPILVLVQETELEPRQLEFLARIRGSWGEGVFHGGFTGAGDVGAKVVAALSRQRAAVAEDGPAAQARARELAGAEERGGFGRGPQAKVIFVPLRRSTLLDPLALEDPGLAEDVIAALRSAGAIAQSVGVRGEVSATGVRLSASERTGEVLAAVEPDGAITVCGELAGEGLMGGMIIDPARLDNLLAAAARGARSIWDRIDGRAEVRQIAVSVAVLGAQYAAYGAGSGGSVPMGGSIPAVLVAPEPPAILTRAELDQELARNRILAAVRRVFADAGRVV